MRKFPFSRIHGPDHDLCIRSIKRGTINNFVASEDSIDRGGGGVK